MFTLSLGDESTLASGVFDFDDQEDINQSAFVMKIASGRSGNDRQQPPGKSHQDKLEELEQSWARESDALANEYANSFANGGPQYTPIAPVDVCCECNTLKRDKGDLCVFLADIVVRSSSAFKYVNHFGIGIRTTKITFCSFRSDAATLLRHRIFPASPSKPQTAFHLSLLEFYSALRVEGHLAYQAFANACAYVHKFKVHILQLIVRLEEKTNVVFAY